MRFEEFQVFITPLALHFGMVKDVPTWRLYHAALMAPPTPSRQLLDRAMVRAANRKFFPSSEEFRRDAEAERQELLKANPYPRCDNCRSNSGWVNVVLVDGIARVKRCEHCSVKYQNTLRRLGVGEERIALPAAEEVAS